MRAPLPDFKLRLFSLFLHTSSVLLYNWQPGLLYLSYSGFDLTSEAVFGTYITIYEEREKPASLLWKTFEDAG